MPKKSFLERMGLVERSAKTEEEISGLKEIQKDVEAASVSPNSPEKTSSVVSGEPKEKLSISAAEEQELRNKLLNDFNGTSSESFSFVSGEIGVDDLIPSAVSGSGGDSSKPASTMSSVASAEALEAVAEVPSAAQISSVSPVGSVSDVVAAESSPSDVIEEAKVVDEDKAKIPYHTQIAEELPSGELKAEENLKTTPSYKPDPYIGDKLDLIIGAYEKNRLLTIDEIYKNSRMETDTKKTIFMTDVFLQAIPANLPQDVKRETVLNILKISGIDLEVLLSDAYKRIDSLNKVLEETVSTSNDIYERNENTIRELERRIQDLREVNTARQQFQEDQNTMIQYEVQKIINLVEFVKPKTI